MVFFRKERDFWKQFSIIFLQLDSEWPLWRWPSGLRVRARARNGDRPGDRPSAGAVRGNLAKFGQLELELKNAGTMPGCTSQEHPKIRVGFIYLILIFVALDCRMCIFGHHTYAAVAKMSSHGQFHLPTHPTSSS